MSETPPASAAQVEFLAELVERGFFLDSGVPGVYGRGEVFEDLRARFDTLVTAAAAAQSPERMRFPPVLPRHQLETSGYLHSFPHLLATVFAFEGTEQQAHEQERRADRHEDWGQFQRMTDLVLVPAACYPVYPALARRGALPPGGAVVDAGGAWVFRREPSRDPARLQMFHQREMVRVGSPEDVRAWRDDWSERGLALLRELGLDARRERASDPFFGRGGRMLAASQRDLGLKFELAVPIAGDEPTAVTSFNYHEQHFGERFGLALADGACAHTACLGFGQERIVLALIRAHGFDPASWPDEVRLRLWGEGGVVSRREEGGERAATPLAASLGRPFYIDCEPDRAFAILHEPPDAAPRPVGVLVCPAFGWDELCVHRSMRVFADLCAREGHPALRFDLPGGGDSAGSPRDPGRLDAWTAAVAAAARVLRERAGAERVVGVGIGLGGMLACHALAAGAGIDDLVLWSVPPRGSLLLREMRALAAIAAAETAVPGGGEPVVDKPEDGSMSVAGFVLSAETIAALNELDLTATALGDAPAGRRVLLLGRDTLPVDRRLREHLERSGAEVLVEDGPGYGAMMVDPQLSEVPYETLSRILAWLAEAPAQAARVGGAANGHAADAPLTGVIELREEGAAIRERPFEFLHRGRRLSGVLAEPVSTPPAPITAVLLNAGAVRRVGSHRMWVDAARRWAAMGVPTLRFDMSGMGDSDGEERCYHLNVEFHRDGFAEQVRSALDALEAAGMPNRFLLCGVCSGAYWSFHAALADERVKALMLVNLLAFFWSDALGAARDARRTRALLRRGALREIVRIVAGDRWRIGRFVRTKLGRIVHRLGGADARQGFDVEIVAALDTLREREVQTLLMLGNGEPLLGDLAAERLIERLDRWPNLHFEHIDVNDHVFRPLWAQRFLADALAGELTRVLADANAHAGSPLAARGSEIRR